MERIDPVSAARAVSEAVAGHAELVAGIPVMSDDIASAASLIASSLEAGGQVLLCGNGGSAADAQHLAAELTGRYLRERDPWPAIALSTNTSALTAIGNDYGFDEVFARQVRAHGRAGDVLIAISTSGASANVLAAIDAARGRGMRVIGMTGPDGGAMSTACDVLLAVPAAGTPRIQEGHIMLGHILCGLVEDALS